MQRLGIGCGGIVAAYLIIGLCCGVVANVIDKTSSFDPLVMIVVAAIWPFWLFLLAVFGG